MLICISAERTNQKSAILTNRLSTVEPKRIPTNVISLSSPLVSHLINMSRTQFQRRRPVAKTVRRTKPAASASSSSKYLFSKNMWNSVHEFMWQLFFFFFPPYRRQILPLFLLSHFPHPYIYFSQRKRTSIIVVAQAEKMERR
jgi:hypothetical protein